MPRLSCWFVRATLLHLAAGVVLGGLILGAKGLPTALAWAWLLLPAHIQIMVGGWLIQLALGMAYWILPRVDTAGTRGWPGWAWASFVALNAGVTLAAVLLVVRSLHPARWVDLLLLPAAALQALALLAFVLHAWPRVAPITLSAEARERVAATLLRGPR